MDITINYTDEQLKQQMLQALVSRMSSLNLKKTVTTDDLKLEVKVRGDRTGKAYPLEELKITINLPE